jgi:hypothetical protein
MLARDRYLVPIVIIKLQIRKWDKEPVPVSQINRDRHRPHQNAYSEIIT